MISLLMGLFIALAAVGLAKTATNTFYEQARVSGVEGAVRAASERLRNDLSRASYMSTANIQWDPKVSRQPGVPGADKYRVTALQDLQGLRVAPSAIRTHALSMKNQVKPQDVFISGNLTSDDVYRGQFRQASSACAGGGAVIRLNSLADPAVRRLFAGTATAAERVQMTQLVFMPGERMNPPQPGNSYAVQVMDMRGCFNYMTICGVTDPGTANEVELQLGGEAGLGILTTAETMGDVCGGRLMEEVAIAPIQRVKWTLAQEADGRRLDPVVDVSGTLTKKINLERQLLAADGTTAIGPAEVVAEYAVDLKLALMVDATPGTPVANPGNLTSIDFEAVDADFEKWAGSASATSSSPFIGPQRIRSARYRLAFRTPIADRRTDLLMPGGPPYMSRYCTTTADPCLEYARVRTIISEVALLNQAKATY
jgi:hypothetical protein